MPIIAIEYDTDKMDSCPFCGQDQMIAVRIRRDGGKEPLWALVCPACDQAFEISESAFIRNHGKFKSEPI